MDLLVKDTKILKLNRKVNSVDPFKGLFYPNGATGYVISIKGYVLAQCEKGYHYVFREVKNSVEYRQRNGEEKIGSSDWFLDTYWRFKTKSECRWFIKQAIIGREHYKQMYNDQIILEV